MSNKKNILVITYGPVPTPEYKTIEGGGMRAWGLAKGLTANGHGITVAVNEGFTQTVAEHESIKLTNWTLDKNFKQFINSFDAVIASYCMGDVSVFIADNIEDDTVLILDAYVPIYIEVSARDSDDTNTELVNYTADLVRFNHVLRRGDYFLCANNEQLDFYTGVLSSLGVINPATYRDKRILVTPFGIHKDESTLILKKNTNPYDALGIDPHSKILLWFGGLYPWFNFEPLLSAVEQAGTSVKNLVFVVVGGKNPFNSHPDFIKQYDFVRDAVANNETLSTMTHFVDWVDYNDRLSWYQGASMVVSINSDGQENHFAWRTRIMDFLTSSLPILTNGGDPLSDFLISENAAIKIDSQHLGTQLIDMLNSPHPLKKVRENLSRVARDFYWDDITTAVSEILATDAHPYQSFKKLSESLHINTAGTTSSSSVSLGNRKIDIVKKYYRKAKAKGLKRSFGFATKTGLNYIRSKTTNNEQREKQAFFLSHPIDETGAPMVLLDVLKDFSKHYTPKHINIVAPGILPYIKTNLKHDGFSLHKMAMGISKRLIHMQLGIQKDDFVMMNTVALYDDYRLYVYWLLETNQLTSATWFIHEDKPELRFENKNEVRTIERLINQHKLIVKVPSSQTATDYNAFFHTDKVSAVDLRIAVPKKYITQRASNDFKELNFIISGTPEDGRKGQLLFLSALQYYEKNLKKTTVTYRDYKVTFIAIGDDYISSQIKVIGDALLGDKFIYHPKVPKDKALTITSGCNVTVCASLNETFALFVAEGMTMGHVVIRNHSSGWEEQMLDGENGYLFDENDLKDFAEKIQLVLNTQENSNTQLQKFGEKSQDIIKKYLSTDYFNQLT